MKTLVALALLALQQSPYDKAIDAIIEKSEKAETGPEKVGIGDELVKLLPKFPKQRQDLLDTASVWYGKAWPDLDDTWKAKLRERLDRLYVPPVPGKASKGPIPGWGGILDESSVVEVSNRKVRSGGAALRVSVKKPGAKVFLQTPTVSVTPGKKVQVSAWVLSDQTKGTGEGVRFVMSDAKNAQVWDCGEGVRPDVPVWVRISGEVVAPEKAFTLRLDLAFSSESGCLWVDDVSVKVDGKEMFSGGGFER